MEEIGDAPILMSPYGNSDSTKPYSYLPLW